MRKAKNCPPWTSRKLHRYREKKRKEQRQQKELMESLFKDGAKISKAMEGTGDA